MRFVIKGEPVPKGRPKLSTWGGYARAYTPKKTREAEESIRAQIIKQLPNGFSIMEGAVLLRIVVARTKPKSSPKTKIYPTQKPDLDNYIKTVLDAMNKIVFCDDSQVCYLVAKKEFGKPETVIDVEEHKV